MSSKIISSQDNDSLSVVVPIYNEETSLPAVLAEIVPYCQEHNWELILVDDGSTDGTSKILGQLQDVSGLKIIRHKVNKGYGGALKTGIQQVHTSHLVTLDADGQHSVSDVKLIFASSLSNQADLVIGKRGRQAGSGVYRSLGRWLIRTFASLLMPIHVSDLNSGFKLYRTELARKFLRRCPDSMAFSDVITLVFIKKRALVLEHPITINKRAAGRSTITTFTAFQTLMEIINITMLFNPLRIFLPLAGICIGFGFIWGIPIMLQGRGVSVGAMLGIVTGLLFFFIGLIAEQLSSLRMGMLDLDQGENKTGKEEK